MIQPNNSKLEELKIKGAAAVAELDSSGTVEKKHIYSYEELYEEKDEIQKFLIPDLIPDEELCVMIGVDGIGKTQILSQLCFCIGTKRTHFLGLQLNLKHARSLVVATEDSRKKFTAAITKIGKNLDPNHKPKDVGLSFMEGDDFADLPSFIATIEEHLKENPCDLVIVDVLQDIFLLINGEINSNSHANEAMQPFKKLCTKYGCALIFIHHASKSSAKAKQEKGKFFLTKDDSQGAGRITQKARTVLGLTHDFASSGNDDDSTEYTNYLHILKTNTTSRHFMKNAIQCIFDQKTLLHEANGLVNIDRYENEDKSSGDFQPSKKAMAKDIPFEDHRLKIDEAFGSRDTLSRKDLVHEMRVLYGVGGNKIEEKEGYLNHIIELGIVINNSGIFRKGEESNFKMPVSTMDWETKIIPVEAIQADLFIISPKKPEDFKGLIIKPDEINPDDQNSDIPF